MRMSIEPRYESIPHFITPAILAGFAIGIGAIVNLKYPGIIGAIFFTFGLATICHQEWDLFTGKIGLVSLTTKNSWIYTILIIFLNFLGISLISALALVSFPGLKDSALTIVNSRLDLGFHRILAASIPCGFIMTWAVNSAKGIRNSLLPMMFGVPLFILCGFPHCIADLSYYIISQSLSWDIFFIWIATVIGNSIGARIHLCLF